MVSIIFVNYNGLQYTKQCLESFVKHHQQEMFDIIVVDNHSTDGSQNILPKLFPFIQFLPLPQNYGFGAANNAGARIAKGDILFFVNNDTIFKEPVVDLLVQYLLDDETVGIVGPQLLNEDGSFQLSFGKFPTIKNEHQTKSYQGNSLSEEFIELSSNSIKKKDWLTGAALMMKKAIFEMIKGFDEKYFMYFEDIDLCKSIHAIGYHCVYVPTIHLIHLGGKSYQRTDSRITIEYRRSQLRYYDKHNSSFQRLFLRVYLFIWHVLPNAWQSEKGNSKALFKLLVKRN